MLFWAKKTKTNRQKAILVHPINALAPQMLEKLDLGAEMTRNLTKCSKCGFLDHFEMVGLFDS